MKNLQEIKSMLTSSDNDIVYLAVSMIRSNKDLKISTEKVPIIKKIKYIEDIYIELGKERKLPYSNSTNKQELSLNASYDIQNISECLNGSWKPIFAGKQRNYYLYFKRNSNGSGWLVGGAHADWAGGLMVLLLGLVFTLN